MSLNPTTFETIVPSRCITFTFPNPFPHPLPILLHTPLIRISVTDSPSPTSIRIAAMLVPPNRESDWIFFTESGHLQLLLSFPEFSRLILIANNSPNCSVPISYKLPRFSCSDTDKISEIEEILMPILLALTPKSAFVQNKGLPEIPFLSYEDEVIQSSVLEVCFGPCAGEMLIENVELELGDDGGREFRRRLRFKRMPNLVQSQVRIHLRNKLDLVEELDGVEFRVDAGVLVQPYLSPMVAGLSVISSHLDRRIQEGFRPKALCLGVGGGALVSFMTAQLGFEVVAVEEDEVVLSLAKKYFGLRDSELAHFCVGDGVELVKKLAFDGKYQNLNSCNGENGSCLGNSDGKFDVIMVDLDSNDARIGTSAPPLEFVTKSVLLAAREIISGNGVLIINVIPPSKSFYEKLVAEFQEVFKELYEIDVGNGENMVLVASVSEIHSATSDCGNHFLQKLKTSIQESYINSMKNISRIGNCRFLR